MRILVDCLSQGYGGSTTYLRELLPRLAESQHELTLLVGEGKVDRLPALPAKVRTLKAGAFAGNPYARHFYQKLLLPRVVAEDPPDVVFVPGGITGIDLRESGVKLVTMVRNMLVFDESERARYSWTEYPKTRTRLEVLRTGLARTLKRSDRVICVSEHCRRVVSMQVPGPEYIVIRHGVSEAFRTPAPRPDDLLRGFGVTGPYWVYVSILSPYKHQDRVVEAVAQVKAQGHESPPPLLLVGPDDGPFAVSVRKAAQQSQGRVICTGSLAPSRLPALLQHADLLFFGSTCENCPNILLEYLAAGRPIVCSDVAPMPEFGGDAVRYADFTRSESVASAVLRLTAERSCLDELKTRARQRGLGFSWDLTAEATLDALTRW